MASVRADIKKRRPDERLISILDDLDLSWHPAEVVEAVEMRVAGNSIYTMAAKLRPCDKKQDAIDEVALLIMHLKRQKLIKVRKNGLFGN